MLKKKDEQSERKRKNNAKRNKEECILWSIVILVVMILFAKFSNRFGENYLRAALLAIPYYIIMFFYLYAREKGERSPGEKVFKNTVTIFSFLGQFFLMCFIGLALFASIN